VEWLRQPGYPALFTVSLLASTLLPLGSEWLLALMLTQGYQPIVAVAVATLGNTLGACTTWLVGRYGGGWLLTRLLTISDRQRQRAEAWYRRYGAASLLFSWLPVVGDPLCLVGGVLRINPLLFLLLVATGKLARYSVVAWLTLQIAG
jgi:membrane protein YqaA with SNARE-associated domain